ncbi:DUF2961 domain-containing protein [Amycolatopsis pigmentata]|uniref:DUF2961 domain-containing protein n=1 Tax=Amycolatopsis pigmentata TaxID=450801 RepID=A0ABW5G642_9PSEU
MTDPLATLSTDPLRIDKIENVRCGPQSELTLFDRTGPGVVKSLWMALGGGNNPTLDGRVRIYYDGRTSPDMDIDVGTLFATHWGAGSTYGSHSTPHMHVEIDAETLNTAFLFGFPMPFGQSIRIAYYNPAGSQTADVYSMAAYTLTATDTADGRRLRCQGARFMDQAQTRQPGDVTTFATITGGPGSIVYHAYVGGVDAAAITPDSGNGRSWMERNISIAVDGENTPGIVSTGTEDWFDSGWYFEGWKDYGTSVHSYVGTDQPPAQPDTVGMVTDLWSKWGGVPFRNSAVMQAQPEPACVTGDRFCYAVLYYQ